MNVKLLKEIKKHIAKEPSWFDMAWWFSTNDQSSCGTAACIAGWAVCLNKMQETGKDFPEVNGKMLGVSGGYEGRHLLEIDHAQSDRLFYSNRWPEPFRSDYHAARTPCERARVAAARIDYFIETNGTDKE